MLDPKTTALVLIDLQKGIVGNPQLSPRSGSEILAGSIAVAEKFRAAGALVVLVHVAFAKDYADMPSRAVDQPMQLPEGGLPDSWSEFADGIEGAGDLKVLKRQWGAFYGTDLDLQLRRRGIQTIVLGGISTNFGVESTARSAWEHGYAVEIAEDLCAGASREAHDFAVGTIFPRISHVIQSADIALATQG
jgi:nicotinamidase-related amidase